MTILCGIFCPSVNATLVNQSVIRRQKLDLGLSHECRNEVERCGIASKFVWNETYYFAIFEHTKFGKSWMNGLKPFLELML